jgi:hypothetical protein
MEHLNEDYEAANVRLSAAQHQQEAALSKLAQAQEQREHALFVALKPTILQDGNQWCVLYGEDLQVGIAGFGDSPHLAVLDFNTNWYKSL